MQHSSVHRSLQSRFLVHRLNPISNYPTLIFHLGVNPDDTVRRYASLHESENKSMKDHSLLFAVAMWFSTVEVRGFKEICDDSADTVGLLPLNLPVQAISSCDLCGRITVGRSIAKSSRFNFSEYSTVHTFECSSSVYSTQNVQYQIAICFTFGVREPLKQITHVKILN